MDESTQARLAAMRAKFLQKPALGTSLTNAQDEAKPEGLPPKSLPVKKMAWEQQSPAPVDKENISHTGKQVQSVHHSSQESHDGGKSSKTATETSPQKTDGKGRLDVLKSR